MSTATLPVEETLAADFAWLTAKQVAAIANVHKRWTIVSDPTPMLGGGNADGSTAIVRCTYREGGHLWLAVEPDGHTHS